MATNIALQSGVISVTEGSGEPKYYFGAVGKYGFSTDQSKVRVQIFYSPGVDEYNIPFSDLMVGGQTPSSVEEAKVLLNAVFLDANSSSGGSGSSYLVYTALFSQSGTSNPSVTVLQNTLSGSISWVRSGVGVYDGTLAGTFPQLKTVIPNFINFDGVGTSYIPITDGVGTPSVVLGYYSIYRSSDDIIEVVVVNAAGNLADFSSIAGTSLLTIDFKVFL